MLGLSLTEMDTWPLAQLGAGQGGSAILAPLQGCCSAQSGRRKSSPDDELWASVWPEVSLLTWSTWIWRHMVQKQAERCLDL